MEARLRTEAGDLLDCGDRGGRRGPAVGRRAGRLRDPRSALPLAVRPAVQLRADLRPPRRFDLGGALLGRRSCSTVSTTTSPPPTATMPTSSRMPPGTRPWACTRCGPCATRSPASARPSCCPTTTGSACASRTCSAFAATRPPPRRCSRPCSARALDGHPTPATPFVRLATGASGVGLASSIGLAIAARDRLRRRLPADPHLRGRRRAHAGPRGRGAGGRRHGLACQRRRCTSTGTRPRSTASASAARAASPATTSSGSPASSSTCTTGTSCGSPTATTSSRSWRPSARRWRSPTASPPR